LAGGITASPTATVIAPLVEYLNPSITYTFGWYISNTDVNNKIDDPNVMYVAHFYAATHGDNIRNKVLTAINGGVPVFISECSVCEASGNGAVGEASATAWFNLLKENNISYVAWNISNKSESSALISSSCSKLSGFTVDELSDTGKWFRTRMRSDRGLD